MTIVLRHLQPCRRCPGLPTCEIVSRELGDALERIEWMAAKAGRKLPDVDLALDCRSFSPHRPSSANKAPT